MIFYLPHNDNILKIVFILSISEFIGLKAVGATAVARDKVDTVGRRRSFIRRHLFAPAGAKNNWDWSAAPRAHPGQRGHWTKSGSVTLLRRASTALPKSGPRPPPSPPTGGGSDRGRAHVPP